MWDLLVILISQNLECINALAMFTDFVWLTIYKQHQWTSIWPYFTFD
jgi:hypothetical protein